MLRRAMDELDRELRGALSETLRDIAVRPYRMTPEEKRAWLHANHGECNAFCRDGRHAQVLGGHNITDPEEAARDFCRRFGLRFVAVHPAPEATIDPGATARYVSEDGDIIDYSGAGAVPWLIVWEEGGDGA